jgi:hypothetical protein
MLRLGILLTMINAMHYAALKDSLIAGDAVFAFAIRDQSSCAGSTR